MSILTARTQQKTDIKQNWDKAVNFIPLKGEIIVYSDLHQIKVGDGVTKLADLEFLTAESTLVVLKENPELHSIVFNKGEANAKYSIAGGSNDKSLLTDIIGDVAGILAPTPDVAKANGIASISYGAGTISHAAGTLSMGVNSHAGCLGYYIWSVNSSTNTLELSLNQKPILFGSRQVPTKLDWKAGDVLSIVNGEAYPLSCKITSVDTTNKTVTVDALPFTSLDTSSRNVNDMSVCVVSKPDSGEVALGFGSFAYGYDCKATGLLSTAIGYQNTAIDTTSFVTGRENTSAFAGFVGGYQNTVTGGAGFSAGSGNTVTGSRSSAIGGDNVVSGDYSHIAGLSNELSGNTSAAFGHNNKSDKLSTLIANQDNEARANISTVFGYHNKTAEQQSGGAQGFCQTVVGRYNDYDSIDSALFVVGNGNDENSRSNALAVNRDGSTLLNGNVNIKGDSTHAGKVTVKGKIDNTTNNSETLLEAGTVAVKTVKVDNGDGTYAPSYALKVGPQTQTNGSHSLAVGAYATTSAPNTAALGYGSHANIVSQTVVGRYNDYETLAADTGKEQAIFVVGNGDGDTTRSNALVVRRNGNTEIAGRLHSKDGKVVGTGSTALGTESVAYAKDSKSLGYQTQTGLPSSASKKLPNTTAIVEGPFDFSNPSKDELSFNCDEDSTGIYKNRIVIGGAQTGGLMGTGYLIYNNIAPMAGMTVPFSFDYKFDKGHLYQDIGIELPSINTLSYISKIYTLNAQNIATEIYTQNCEIILKTETIYSDGEISGYTYEFIKDSGVINTNLTIPEDAISLKLEFIFDAWYLSRWEFALNNLTLEAQYPRYAPETVGANAVAIGANTAALETNSFAGGSYSKASAENSMAFGDHTIATGDSQAVVGKYNERQSDALFVVGNGENEDSRSNALVVDKNGKVKINGELSFESISPEAKALLQQKPYVINYYLVAIPSDDGETEYNLTVFNTNESIYAAVEANRPIVMHEDGTYSYDYNCRYEYENYGQLRVYLSDSDWITWSGEEPPTYGYKKISNKTDMNNQRVINVANGVEDTDAATVGQMNRAIADMVDSAPETLNTLNELAAALGDDANFAATVATQIGNLESKVGDTSVEEQINKAVKNTLVVTMSYDDASGSHKSSHTPAEIYEHTQNGGTVVLHEGDGVSGIYMPLRYVDESSADFFAATEDPAISTYYVYEDGTIEHDEKLLAYNVLVVTMSEDDDGNLIASHSPSEIQESMGTSGGAMLQIDNEGRLVPFSAVDSYGAIANYYEDENYLYSYLISEDGYVQYVEIIVATHNYVDEEIANITITGSNADFSEGLDMKEGYIDNVESIAMTGHDGIEMNGGFIDKALRIEFVDAQGLTAKIRLEQGNLRFLSADDAPVRLKGVADGTDDTDAVNVGQLNAAIGDIESALDSIIAIQNGLIGGNA